jgi:hypothetical protein
MSTKIIVWGPDRARLELKKRFDQANQARRRLEPRWTKNENSVYGTGGSGTDANSWAGFESADLSGADFGSEPDSDIGVSYAFKNLRFLHAQLSANPPSVVARPASNDQDDRMKADAADRLVRHAIRIYGLPEIVDKVSLGCLLHGTSFMRVAYDVDGGDPLEVDEETGEMTMEGEISFESRSAWHIWVDPDSSDFYGKSRYLFDRTYIPFEEAIAKFGEEKRNILEAHRMRTGDHSAPSTGFFSDSSVVTSEKKWDSVEVLEYWETGLPTNGYLGRHCYCVRSGELLTDIGPSPHRFVKFGAAAKIRSGENLRDGEAEARIKKLPAVAKLPYHIFTDVDIPDSVWGRSFLEYVNRIQDVMNRLDATVLDNIQAHGVTRLVLPDGAELSEDSVTNTPWEVVKIVGNQGPYKLEAPGSMPLIDNFRAQLKVGLDDMAGVNESMFGQQSREQSNASMQYATNQGNMIRRRLFNKYTIFVENIYRTYLALTRKHWTVARTIAVIGKEKALEAVEIKGADIDGGFDLVVEYGTSLSLDPITRREEILSLQPMFEKAGVPPRVSLKMMKLNELEGMYDIIQMAEDRQREIFEEMIGTGRYVKPTEQMDHENMIAYALQYFMSTEFKYLPDEAKALCLQHNKDRAAQAAAEKTAVAGETGGQIPGGPMPPGPAPGAPGPGEVPVDMGLPVVPGPI